MPAITIKATGNAGGNGTIGPAWRGLPGSPPCGVGGSPIVDGALSQLAMYGAFTELKSLMKLNPLRDDHDQIASIGPDP